MNTREAFDVLGLANGVEIDEIRSTYRRLLLTHHPDVAGPAANAHTTLLIEAYKVASAAAVMKEGLAVGTAPTPDEANRPDVERDATPTVPDLFERISLIANDTVAITAHASETYALLYEAASRVGEISYFDRSLGILESILRFEGGPTCSLLMTLQGRAFYTEIFCTIESIEAAPTPSITPVINALVHELRALA